MSLSRRDVMAGLASMAMLDTARAATPVTVLTPFGFIVDFLEMMNAKAGGHFERAGLDVQLLGAGGAAAGVQQLAAGRCQFTRASPIDIMKASSTQTNLSLVSIATIFQGSTFFVISSTEKPIAKAEDMRGKRMGVVSVGGTTENLLDLMLFKVGIPRTEVPREVVGNNPGSFALLQQGRIDGFIASSNVVEILQHQKLPVLAWSSDRYAKLPSQAYFTTQEVIDKQPDVVLAYVKAMKASVEEMLTAPLEPILDRAAAQFEIPGIRDKEGLLVTVRKNFEFWVSEGRPNLLRNVPELWKSARDILAETGIATIPDEKKLYTNRFLDEVAKG